MTDSTASFATQPFPDHDSFVKNIMLRNGSENHNNLMICFVSVVKKHVMILF